LFDDVRICTDRQLSLLATRILQQSHPRSRGVEDWIHDIEVMIPSVGNREMHFDQLLTVLIHAHRLCAFRYHHPIKASHLSCLAHTTGSQLKTLLVEIDVDGEACIPLIGRMDTLEDLTLSFSASRPPPLIRIAPISLPRVRRLSLRWASTFTSHAARFLFSGVFRNMQVAQIAMTHLTPEFAPNFTMFVLDREHPLDDLSLEMPPAVISTVSDALLRCATSLRFFKYVPPANVMDGWSRYSPLRFLAIGTPLPANSLWPLLEKLRSPGDSRFVDSGFKLIITLDSAKFTWDSGTQSDNLAYFIGRLVFYSRTLKKRGIYVIDENGQTMFD
jgi:hypothetical protein